MLSAARRRIAAAALSLAALASPSGQATNYTVINLDTVTPAGVNNHGQVAVQQGLWSGGMLVPMVSFIDPVEPSGGDVLDINDAGQILGRANYNIAGPCQSTSSGYRLSVLTDGALACAPGYNSQFPGRMNSAGKVAYYTWIGDPMGFVWDSQTGTNTQLAAGPPGPDSSIYQIARDINDLDDVVGRSSPPSATGGTSHALRWQGSVVTDLGSGLGEAVAVGNGGQIVLGSGHLWDAGVLTNMGVFTPTDVNGTVVVVGSQQVAGSPRAVAWQGGLLSDLNDLIPPASGWVLQSAARISDNGYIVGTGTFGGQSHGFLLVPDTITPAQADLTVTASISPPGNYVSGPVTVTFTVTNNGPATATRAALITNYRPYQFVFSPTITPSQGSCRTNAWNDQYVSDPTAYVWCALGSLAPGASATVQLTANSVAQNTTLGASAHAIEMDANTADNAASQNVTKAGADLSVVMNDSPDPVQAVQPLTYTAVVSNAGPDAGSAVLNSSTPSGMTYVSASPSQGSCTGTGVVQCTLGNIPVGSSATVQLVVTPTTVGSFTRLVSVSGSGPADPVPGNNNASTTTSVSGVADLSLTMTTASTVIQGQTILYTINATNNGPAAVANVIATGTLPTCSFGTIAAGATSANCIRTVTASTPGTVTQTMTVSSPATDPNPGNDSATVSTTVLANAADLTLAVSDSPDPVTVGGTVTYTITATNNGPLGANNVTATGSLPTCNFGGLAAGSSASCTDTAIASSAGTLTQNMTVSATSPVDPNPRDNSATASTTVLGGADLAVTITDSPDPVKRGGRLTYTVVVSNGGPQSATGVGLSVVLPANITFESATSSQGTCNGTATVSCALGSLGSSSSASVTIRIKPKSAGTATATASVTGSPADPNGANNAATASTTVKK